MSNLTKKNGGLSTPARSLFPDVFSDIDRLMDNDFFLMPLHLRKQFEGRMPAVNIRENEKEYLIEVAAPGMKKEDFSIDMEENTLTIRSEKKEESSENKDNYRRREYNYTSFSRSFNLPENVKSDEIKARYVDGILHLAVPKKQEQQKPKHKIAID